MPRDLLRELVVLARTPEPDFLNVGNFVAEHAGELAHLLSTTPADLEASAKLTDDEVVTRLRPRLQGAIARRDEGRTRRREEDARGAAERLRDGVSEAIPSAIVHARGVMGQWRRAVDYMVEDVQKQIEEMRMLTVIERSALEAQVLVEENVRALPEHVPLYSFVNALTASAKAAAPARRLELEAVAGELLEQHVGRAS